MPATLEPEQGLLEQRGMGKAGGKKNLGGDKGPTPVGPADKCASSELGSRCRVCRKLSFHTFERITLATVLRTEYRGSLSRLFVTEVLANPSSFSTRNCSWIQLTF